MRLIALLVALAIVAGCGRRKEPKEDEVGVKPDLAAKFMLYSTLSNTNGAWLFGDCDATLKEGLRGTYASTDLQEAEKEPGEWFRRPLSLGDCYEMRHPDGSRLSASRISRDMLLGVGWWAWSNGRPDVARSVVEYADANGDIMGPGVITRTDIRAQLKATFLKIAGSDRLDSHTPIVVSGTEKDFGRHLAAQHLFLRAEVTGGMPEGYSWWLRQQAEEQPSNPLYALLVARYLTGDYETVKRLLMDETHWPNDRLPTSAEHCSDWLIQRDMGSDWEPCPDHAENPRRWSGSDWLFVASWISG